MKIFKLFLSCILVAFCVDADAAQHPAKRNKNTMITRRARPHRDDDPHRHDAQIMAQNFVNILVHMFIAAHKEHDKEARLVAITTALQSLANIFKLIIRSADEHKTFNSQEELIAWIYAALMDELMVEECENALHKKARYLRMMPEEPSK